MKPTNSAKDYFAIFLTLLFFSFLIYVLFLMPSKYISYKDLEFIKHEMNKVLESQKEHQDSVKVDVTFKAGGSASVSYMFLDIKNPEKRIKEVSNTLEENGWVEFQSIYKSPLKSFCIGVYQANLYQRNNNLELHMDAFRQFDCQRANKSPITSS